jgi:uncharacterized protein (DUF885 family)
MQKTCIVAAHFQNSCEYLSCIKRTNPIMPKKFLPQLLCAALLGSLNLPTPANAADNCCTKPATAQAPTPTPTPTPTAAQTPDQALDQLSQQFLEALWQVDPEAALSAGRYEGAANLAAPDQQFRTRQLAFLNQWTARLQQVPAAKLSPKQATDLAVLKNTLKARRWYLTTFREFEWNPADYNIASAIDMILSTDYAPLPQRLRALTQRLAQVPAYYAAARAAISNPTREHTQLAIKQGPGVLQVLDQLEQMASSADLSTDEKQLLQQRSSNARSAVTGYINWLVAQDKLMERRGNARSGGSRSFRIGKTLYEAKFAADIQSPHSAHEMYERALVAKEALLVKMNTITDELWPQVLPWIPKPKDRSEKIGMMIDNLSRQHVAPDQFITEVRRQLPELQEWVVSHNLLGVDASKPLVVRETPLYQRGVAAAGIEAPGPYRPQDQTYYNVSPLTGSTPEQAESTLREYNRWILQILNIHEAIPGHYTQLVYANKSPSIVKTLFGNGAMIEGWAVYGERMMLESGYGGNTPEMWLMYSKWNLRTACNTILDYSTHVLNMSEADAMHLLTHDAFQTEAEARGKWRRVQLSSVQLTSYFSGFSDILELREQRKQALGDKFNLKDFHERFLSYGSAPVGIIKDLMQK